MCLRYGLFKCTRERIRQLKSKALKKLRNPNAIQRLKGYLS
ncbi:MAG: sigma factor-like helix-turn-helix DNA-binding protein [Prochloraceae cyanobacterium]